MTSLTEVVSSFRGWTLACQVLASLVAFSALSQRDALTGPAQVVGLVVYLVVFVGSCVMAAVRWGGVPAPHPLDAPVTSLPHFACAAFVNVSLLTALFLVTGNTEDSDDKDPALNRIEVAAVAGAMVGRSVVQSSRPSLG